MIINRQNDFDRGMITEGKWLGLYEGSSLFNDLQRMLKELNKIIGAVSCTTGKVHFCFKRKIMAKTENNETTLRLLSCSLRAVTILLLKQICEIVI